MTDKTEKTVTMDDFLIKGDKSAYFDTEEALAYLFREGIVFANSRPYITNPWEPKEKHITGESTLCVFVLCNDVFAWGTADAENITATEDVDIETNELYRLMTYVLENKVWGGTKYACWKRNLQPQKPVINRLKSEGIWDEWWEALPTNSFE